MNKDVLELAQFWSKVDVSVPANCWEWRAGKNDKGYGRYGEGKAHRHAYELVCGPIDEGKMVLHRCDNPACVNPHHLWLGDARDNALDMMAKGRHKPMRGKLHGKCKLTDEQVREIRESKLRGVELAADYGVAESTISYIRSFRTRQHA